EVRTRGWQAETVAETLGLPILARSRPGRAGSDRAGKPVRLRADESRGVALRIRQYTPETGAVILLSSLNYGPVVAHLVIDLSHHFAMRNEKVLVLDARIANSSEEGLPRLIARRINPNPMEVAPAEKTSSGQASPGTTGLVQYLVFEGQDPARFIVPT